MFYDFRNTFLEQICFSNKQIELVFPKFDYKNLVRWQQKAYIIKLRNGLYTFTELKNEPGINLYVANRLYQPSYVSLHYALNFYGIIPEVINRVTSVSTLKSKQFANDMGQYSFQTLKTNLFFGYEIKKANKFDIKMASPEKAIIDTFYLYTMYNTIDEIEQLRFDSTVLKTVVNVKKLDSYLNKINNKTLSQRIELMKKVYSL